MWRTYGDQVQFFVVYIREAHPVDGRSPLGDESYVIVEDPLTWLERAGVAKECLAKMELEGMPALIDGMDDAVNFAYGAYPDRLYLVGRDGRIAFQGGPGPFEFLPDELEDAIRVELGQSDTTGS